MCCVREDLAFLTVDLAFHGQWHVFRVRRQPQCRGSFAWLGNHPSLATRKGATVEVVKARYQNCSSKLCLSFGANEPRSLQQNQLCKNHNFGTATSFHSLNIDFAVQKSEAAKLSVATSFPNASQFCIVYGKLCFSDC